MEEIPAMASGSFESNKCCNEAESYKIESGKNPESELPVPLSNRDKSLFLLLYNNVKDFIDGLANEYASEDIPVELSPSRDTNNSIFKGFSLEDSIHNVDSFQHNGNVITTDSSGRVTNQEKEISLLRKEVKSLMTKISTSMQPDLYSSDNNLLDASSAGDGNNIAALALVDNSPRQQSLHKRFDVMESAISEQINDLTSKVDILLKINDLDKSVGMQQTTQAVETTASHSFETKMNYSSNKRQRQGESIDEEISPGLFSSTMIQTNIISPTLTAAYNDDDEVAPIQCIHHDKQHHGQLDEEEFMDFCDSMLHAGDCGAVEHDDRVRRIESMKENLMVDITSSLNDSYSRNINGNNRSSISSSSNMNNQSQQKMSYPDKAWNMMFDRLVQYKMNHGDCSVPKNFADDPKLGNWVSTQRQNRHNLSSNQVEKLKLVGFKWQLQNDIWMEMFHRLVEYKCKFGTTQVPNRYKDDPKLGNWVCTQRTAAKKGSLSEERRKLLDSIEFVWSLHSMHK